MRTFETRTLRPKYDDAYKAWHGVPKEGLSEGMKLLTEAMREMFKSKGKREFWNTIQPHLTSPSTGRRVKRGGASR